MNKESIIAIVRIVLPCIISVLGVVGITNVFGIELATINIEQAAAIIAVIVSGIGSVFTGWVNNNVTPEAQEAQRFLDKMKHAKGFEEE